MKLLMNNFKLTISRVYFESPSEEPWQEFFQHLEERWEILCQSHNCIILVQVILGLGQRNGILDTGGKTSKHGLRMCYIVLHAGCAYP